tara:strand:- start:878 stop:1372 length:495 start_codon:yes stop_codon:yes gene_type:complete
VKLQIRTTFDFGKLANKIENILEKYTKNFSKASSSGIKTALETGSYEPLSDTTIDIRERGISPNSGKIATGSTKPLIHTGRLLSSIKPKKDGVEMNKYGVYQNAGFTTTHNAFTGAYFKETGKQIANQKVPARPFIDRGILIKTKESERAFNIFSKDIKKALKK